MGPGLDVKADGGYVVAPPSIHPSGDLYTWEVEHHPDDVPLAECPAWLVNLLRTKENCAANATAVGELIPEGKRNTTLMSLAGSMRRRGMSQAAIEAALREENRRCSPSLPDDEVVSISVSAARYGPARDASVYPLTDYGNAQRLVAADGSELRYCAVFRRWFVFDGTRWAEDNNGEVMRRAKATVRRIGEEAAAIEDENGRKAVLKWAWHSESEERLRKMVKLAESEPGIAVIPDAFDTDPWLLNCQNGTLDLRDGSLREHRPSDLITKLIPVSYQPDAQCPRWHSFLRHILADKMELVQFLQRAIGYSLAGVTGEQVLFLLYGTGANGKTTLLELLQTLLGDYARTASFDSFAVDGNGHVRNDLARLRGARFVSAAEIEEGRRLSEVIIKQVTGGDTITARFLYAEHFEFRPQFKLFVACNHKPIIRGTDHAIWRRIRLIPFSVTIPDSEQDKTLSAKLHAELPGILAWAVQGCLDWQREGLGLPKEVEVQTSEYRAEMDTLQQFFDECCVINETARVETGLLHRAYSEWAERSEEWVMSAKALGLRLKERGFLPRASHGRRFWYGIGLRADEQAEF